MARGKNSRTTYGHRLICEQPCGLQVQVYGSRVTAFKSDCQNPYTWRECCVNARRSHKVVAGSRRVRAPMRLAGNHYVVSGYAEAIEDIAN